MSDQALKSTWALAIFMATLGRFSQPILGAAEVSGKSRWRCCAADCSAAIRPGEPNFPESDCPTRLLGRPVTLTHMSTRKVCQSGFAGIRT
jgi:hypothetical protein